MTDTFDKIVDAITPSRLLGKKPKARKAAGSNTAARKKHLSTIRKNLDKLSKDIAKLAEMVAGTGASKKAPAKRRTARKTTARKTARAKKS